MKTQVYCFGELMLRLSPPGYQRLLQSPQFEASFGGGEANVAVSLAQLGIQTGFVSRFPENALGDAALGELRRHGLGLEGICRGGERLGLYFCEKGASQRPSTVLYDRANSSIATARPEDFDWNKLFEGAEFFHFTGISPALSDSCAQICLEACQTAKSKGLKVSCDLNYRKKLWSPEKAQKVMSGLMPYVDLLFANEEDAEKVFGLKAEQSNIQAGKLDYQAYENVASQLEDQFKLKNIAITLRKSHSASLNTWAGMYYCDKKAYFSPSYEIQIVDRVGGGDSFAAGLIYSLLKNLPPQEALNLAVAASCLKHSIEGDFNRVSLEEIQALAKGDASGRVQR